MGGLGWRKQALRGESWQREGQPGILYVSRCPQKGSRWSLICPHFTEEENKVQEDLSNLLIGSNRLPGRQGFSLLE